MSAQDILIAHGEKALVLLVTAACGYALYGTFTNPEIRPTNISMEKIQQAAALGLAGFVLFYFGTTLLFSVVTGYAKRLVISEAADAAREVAQMFAPDNVVLASAGRSLSTANALHFR